MPFIEKELYNELVKAYFGGHVDLYIPKEPIYPEGKELTVNQVRNIIKEKGIEYAKENLQTIKHYDVNSLYPSVMKDYLYPTDILAQFIGDITLINHFDYYKFGIYKVSVKCPDNIILPILPIKRNGRTIYPVGNWEGWYNTFEINNAIKYLVINLIS